MGLNLKFELLYKKIPVLIGTKRNLDQAHTPEKVMNTFYYQYKQG